MTDNEIAKLIRESVYGESCKSMNNEDFDAFIKTECGIMKDTLGVKDENKMIYLIAQLQSDIKTSYGMLTQKEVRNVFSLGIRGLLGEWRWFDLQTVTMWLKTYKSKRDTIIYQDNKKKDTQKQIDPPKHESDESWYDFYDKFVKEKGELMVAYNYAPVFRHLERIEEIKMSDEEKEAYLKGVKEKLKHDNHYMATMKQAVNDSDPKVVARKLLVQDYFRKKYNLGK